MKIFIGADHRGYQLKQDIIKLLEHLKHTVIDVGTHEEGVACDYPGLSFKVASEVVKSKNARGILICMTGIGHTIVANKVKGAYAALCYNKETATLAREHNDSNILVLGTKFVTHTELNDIIMTWLETKFEGGRHLRRVRQIKAIERKGIA